MWVGFACVSVDGIKRGGEREVAYGVKCPSVRIGSTLRFQGGQNLSWDACLLCMGVTMT